jgi:hypothetical protein
VTEATTLVDKVGRAFESPSRPAGAHVFATDNQGPGDQAFLGEAQAMAAALPATSTRAFADVAAGVPAARQTLLGSMRGGASFVHYFGHGGPQTWADEGLLTVEDAPDLQDSSEAIVLSWACEAQDFQYLFGPSLSQALLDVSRGGARAAFGPAGITTPGHQKPLYQALYQQLPMAPTLGEAIRRAKSAAITASRSSRTAVEGWNLLGDPALPLSGTR